MPNELGEIAVAVKEDGTQDALDDMADASADSGGGQGGSSMSGSSQGGGGGGVGDLLGGISKKLLAILGFVTFLASLKPIQELLGGIQRLFSTAILPLVALLMTFLRPVLQDLLRFIANLDFDNLIQDLTRKLGSILAQVGEDTIEKIPGVGNEQAANIVDDIGVALFGDKDTNSIFAGTGGTLSPKQMRRDSFISDLLGPGRPGEVNVTGFREQSNTTMDQNSAETSNRETLNSGPGGE